MRRKDESIDDYSERMRQLAYYRIAKIGNHWKGRKHSVETRLKMSQARKKLNLVGPKAIGWIDGRYVKNLKDRYSIENTLWRESVFKRDNWTCQICGQRGVKLHADHIKPFSLFPELRFDIKNGRTLCVPCHRKTDSYGWKMLRKIRIS